MKRFILEIITLIILFIISNILYLSFISKVDWNYKKRLESLDLENPKNEILILGNSLAMDGIDAQLLTDKGLPTYNAAIGGSPLSTNLIQLEEYLKNYEYKPKFVVLGLGSYLNNFDTPGLHPIVEFTMLGKTHFNLNNAPILKFKWLFKEQLKKIVSKEHRDARLIRGQLRFSKSKPDNTIFKKENTFPLNVYTSSRILRAMIDLCNENNIKLIIVEMPGFKKTQHQNQFPCYIIDNENSNGILLDFNNREMGEKLNDNEDWIGNSHLNEKGAKKFTLELLNILKNEPLCLNKGTKFSI